MNPGQRCPKCGWHITPANMEYHRGVFRTAGSDEPIGNFHWQQCTHPEPNRAFLCQYRYNEDTGEWEVLP